MGEHIGRFGGGARVVTAAEVSDAVNELRWWHTIIQQASAHHDALPDPVRDDIDAGASPRELARFAVHMADVSSSNLVTIARTIEVVLDALGEPVSRSGEAYSLRLVGRDDA